ncbi:hypothetical protein CesoFtcFv8_014000 [Champsocephalus esox]|uniref:Uncharacterized protein n=1 Tax=Champsocephalus esox TaxID=159716 RepID=A0AAN8GU96_9TELE|nr:hypothetical protein CesoFtcFv8_014000 [Champsocephalus esox]
MIGQIGRKSLRRDGAHNKPAGESCKCTGSLEEKQRKLLYLLQRTGPGRAATFCTHRQNSMRWEVHMDKHLLWKKRLQCQRQDHNRIRFAVIRLPAS